MKSTAIFATKTDRDNHRSKDSVILAGLWSQPAVQYSWCELWLGVFAMVMFPHRLWNNDNNELFVFSILLPTMSKFAWYVCICMYVYIWYMIYVYIWMCWWLQQAQLNHYQLLCLWKRSDTKSLSEAGRWSRWVLCVAGCSSACYYKQGALSAT